MDFSDKFEELRQGIGPYDKQDLLAITGALQLVPDNASHASRLEILATAVGSSEYHTAAPSISIGRLKRILNRGPLAENLFMATEDPFDNPFMDLISFHGGSYRVFPGFDGTAVFVVTKMLGSLMLGSNSPISNETLTNAYYCAGAVLLISEEIASRANLDHRIEPNDGHETDIVVPNPNRLAALKSAVTFSIDDVHELLSEQRIPHEILDPLIVDCGNVTTDGLSEPSRLTRTPFVRVNGNLVVPIPALLLDSIRNHILGTLIASGEMPSFVTQFRDCLWNTISEDLSTLKAIEVIPPFQLEAEPDIRQGFFRFDKDKLIHALLLTDDLDGYDINNPFETVLFDSDKYDSIVSRCEQTWSAACSLKRQAPNEILFLLLIQDVGRGLIVGSSSQSSLVRQLTMSASDLNTLSMLDLDQLTLWKYAGALQRLQDSTRLVSLGALAAFNLYRSSGYSFYFSDDALPNLISLTPGGAGILRREVRKNYDIHGVLSYDSIHVVEVVALGDPSVIPSYVPLKDLGRRVSLLLEGLPIPVWFIGDESLEGPYHEIAAQLADALAYWFWELSPSLSSVIENSGTPVRQIIVRIDLVEDEGWFLRHSDSSEHADGCIEANSDVTRGEIILTLQAGISQLLCSSNNAGERELVRTLLSSVIELLSCVAPDDLDDFVATAIDLHMPQSNKKKFFFLELSNNPCLDPEGIPKFRNIQDADRNIGLDDLGRYLAETIGVGVIPSRQKQNVLNQAVAYVFQRFESIVATLNPEYLTQTVIGYYESCIHERHFNRLTIPTRIACFGSDSENVSHVNKEIRDIDSTSTVCRFIIEYISAKPPNGYRPLSLSVLDKLQSLAEMLVTLGTCSDLLYYRLADVGLEILPSKRLAIDRQQYDEAVTSFFPSHVADVIGTAHSAYERHWDSFTVEDEPEMTPMLEEAYLAEFGFSLSDHISLISELLQYASESRSSTCCLPEADISSLLSTNLGWTDEMAISVVNRLALYPRAEFLNPPVPYSARDAYPWRTNRSLSYLRKPFVIKQSGATHEFIFGVRHLYEAGRYLLDLCMRGRLDASSQEMLAAMSSIRSKEGRHFNDVVAKTFEADTSAIVRSNVKKVKIGSEKLRPPGDIDVLVARPESKKLILVECKDMSAAFQPHDLRREIDRLLVDTDSRDSVVTKHARRIAWAESNIGKILEWLGITDPEGWLVEGCVVTNSRSLTPYLNVSPLQILVLNDLLPRT